MLSKREELAPVIFLEEGTQSKCSERLQEGCTPPKVESPSDQKTARERKINTTAVKSNKLSFSKPAHQGKDEDILAMTPPLVKKVYEAND